VKRQKLNDGLGGAPRDQIGGAEGDSLMGSYEFLIGAVVSAASALDDSNPMTITIVETINAQFTCGT